MFCTRCGAANVDDARFCFNCGSPLTVAARQRPAEQVPTSASPETTVSSGTTPPAFSAPPNQGTPAPTHQTCPKCGLLSPQSAQQCDCGYSFTGGLRAASAFHYSGFWRRFAATMLDGFIVAG